MECGLLDLSAGGCRRRFEACSHSLRGEGGEEEDMMDEAQDRVCVDFGQHQTLGASRPMSHWTFVPQSTMVPRGR